MASDGQGTIYIPLTDYWEFVDTYSPAPKGALCRYAPPRFTSEDAEIDYAFGTDTAPESWANPPGWLRKP